MTDNRVFKYSLDVADIQSVPLPRFARFLSVAFQGEDLCLWALVDTDQPVINRAIHIRGTGHPATFASNAQFIGTAFHPLGLVFHVFGD